MNMKKTRLAPALLALAVCLVTLPLAASELPPVADVQLDASGVHFQPQVGYGQLLLTMSGPRDFDHRQVFGANETPSFVPAGNLADGIYSYELRVLPALDRETRVLLKAAREAGDESLMRQLQDAGKLPEFTLTQSGAFTILGGQIVADDRPEQIVTKDIVHADDVIISFSLCVGNDCVNGENFGFDTMRLKENNLRIHFDDTSNSASFPANDWRIVINDTSNGGGSYFAVEDSTAGRQVFRVDAGAPANSLHVDAQGDVGIGKSSPVVELHVVDGDSPTLRLEQDGSSGFTAQTFDLVSNEANFFIRDVTMGSQLPFRIKPGADTNSLFIAANNDIGMGTDSPDAPLHIRRTAAGALDVLHLQNNGAARILLTNTADNNEWRFNANTAGQLVVSNTGDVDQEFLLTDTGELQISVDIVSRTGDLRADNGDIRASGNIFSGGGGTCDPGPCDGTFTEYELESIEEHSAYMWEKSHLWGVGPTPEGEPFNLSKKVTGILHELEKAHIYIEQLNERIKELEAERVQD